MNRILKKIFIFPILLYKTFISPFTPSVCRYQPTCSTYMLEAITKWGVVKGIYLGTKRILRCHPWSNHEHFDPVPDPNKKQK